ncbi:IclR family transcriptional regulator [Wukongibacter baidiensis]|uniref:IclR family transcriptional regulator n=1 Tax=Wukongibacter baidiensis TaxID=1723361 RepID=UPI003D7F20C3
MTMNKGNYDTITMVDRAVLILEELFSADEYIGVSEIAQNLDLPKATVYRILNTFYQRNFVEKDNETDRYKLGLIFIQYAEKVKSKLSMKRISEPYMKKLSQDVGETVNLGISHEGNVLNIFSIEGETSALVSKLVPIAPLYCASTGKIFLSQMSDEEIKNYFNSHELEKRTINTIIKYEDFNKEKEQILREKVAFDKEEYEYGLTCMACPITNSKGDTVAALSVSGPTSRLKVKGIDNIIEELRKISKEISERLKEAHL